MFYARGPSIGGFSVDHLDGINQPLNSVFVDHWCPVLMSEYDKSLDMLLSTNVSFFAVFTASTQILTVYTVFPSYITLSEALIKPLFLKDINFVDLNGQVD